ncbi:MAG: pyruvate kinase [Candidatus Woesearchaeota archaeon]
MNLRDKNTKIVATISDMQCDTDFLKKLYDAGMNVVRLNTAHQDIDGTTKTINNIREVSNKLAILLDTKGPEIRTTNIDTPINVEENETIQITGNLDFKKNKTIYVNYTNFHKEIPLGAKILINDGEILFEVIKINEESIDCQVKNNGKVKNKKTINVPSVHLKLPTITQKDKEFIDFAIANNLDFIAHSFVRNRNDVLAVRQILDKQKSKIKIIAKIENREGYENIDEIIEVADGIMVARGDLGVEVLASEVPLMQKSMIATCLKHSKPVIVATQMLESMINNPRATRAEISDVANAILDGADAVMLSGETAYGKYPLDAVRTMSEISINLSKHHRKTNPAGVEPDIKSAKMFLAKSAVEAALTLDADAIITPSHSGEVAKIISAMRSRKPIFAPCFDKTTMRQLSLSHGIRVFESDEYTSTDAMVFNTIKRLVECKKLTEDMLVVFISGTAASVTHTSYFLEIATVKDLLLVYGARQ